MKYIIISITDPGTLQNRQVCILAQGISYLMQRGTKADIYMSNGHVFNSELSLQELYQKLGLM